MLPHGGKERRKLKRVVKRIPIRFETGGLRGQGHIKNLSREGLFIRSHLLPAPGDMVCVVFGAPNGQKVEIIGTVRWTTAQLQNSDAPPGFGVRIDQPGPDFREFYESILLQ